MYKKYLEQWKEKLLDTGRRNQAIHFKKHASSTLSILSPSYDVLLKQLEHKQVEIAQIDPTYLKDYHKDTYTYSDIYLATERFLEQAPKQKQYIFTDASMERQNQVLSHLARKARLFQEENAVHILHLAVGMVHWIDPVSKDLIQSPLVLIPVSLKQMSVHGTFELAIEANELLLNDALIKRMDSDFNIQLSFSFDSQKEMLEQYQAYINDIKPKLNYGWSIHHEVVLGLFSFSRINMVKDLEENEERIINNTLIKALTGQTYDPNMFLIDQEEKAVDQSIDPEKFYQVLDADGSQSVAIHAAVSGKSFVLQGPPGTGKSQTITNMIAELIARGKKVLFVAEKKAALDVVYQNLVKAEISQYALPLHHIDINKKEMIRELNDSLTGGQNYEMMEQNELKSIQHLFLNTKDKLEQYQSFLLEKRAPIGMSFFDIMNAYYTLDKIKNLTFQFPSVEKLTLKALYELEVEIQLYEQQIKQLGGYPDIHPFYGFKRLDFNKTQEQVLKKHLIDAIKQLKEIEKYTPLKQIYMDKYLDELSFKIKLKNARKISEEIFTLKNPKKELNLFKEALQVYGNQPETKELLHYYDEEALTYFSLQHLYLARQKDTFLKRALSFKYKKMVKHYRKYQKEKRTSYAFMIKDLGLMRLSQEKSDEVQKILRQSSYHLETYDYLTLQSVIQKLELYQEIRMHHIFKTMTYQAYISIIETSNEQVYQDMKRYQYLKEHIQDYFNDRNRLNQDETLGEELDRLLEMSQNFNQLYDYIHYEEAFQRGQSLNLEHFYRALDKENIKESFKEIFRKGIYKALLDHFIDHDDEVKKQLEQVLTQLQDDFKTSDRHMILASKYKIYDLIAEQIPNIKSLEGQNHEVLLLKKEGEKARKLKPIRVLFDEIPNLILKLKPILMMSPLSVASFLKTSEFTFDTVIFDEASQVKVESALGAIYRAKQMIVVGDKEQLPPTNFFRTMDQDEDGFDETVAYDSILDLASGTLNVIALKWHYRSQYESLIKVSNDEIYRNLITFPEAQKPENDGVSLVYVKEGRYIQRQNEIEALKVAELVIQQFKLHPNRSLGVVAFSEMQQRAIERAILKIRKAHLEFEPFFSIEKKEPFFIKNIETVQGDERDTILLSVGYGPDEKGHIAMRFGPLNQEGGYRRLNVAITRAKYQVILVSSMLESDIDLNKTNQNKGASLLKKYLEFAQSQTFVKTKDQPARHHLLEKIGTDLEHLGYQVFYHVGQSKKKIDLAIKKEKETSFFFGLELDGLVYQSSSSKRDSERLFKDILEIRHWHIERIWSSIWYQSYEKSFQALLKKIEKAETTKLLSEKESLQATGIKKHHKKAKIIFKEYPNYKELYEEVNTFDRYSTLEGLIKALAPIHEDELKKVVAPIYNVERYSKKIENMYQLDLKTVRYSSDIELIDHYYIVKHQEISFRRVNPRSARRSFERIHPKELEAAGLEIIRAAKTMLKEDFIVFFIKACGFKKSSEHLKTYIEQLIIDLVESGQIRVENELLVYQEQ